MSVIRSLFNRQFLITLILVGLLVLLSFPLSRNWRQKRSIDQEIKGLEQQAAALEGKNSNLKQVLDYMQSSQFVEEEARTKLNYKKSGESVVVIEGRPQTTTETTTSSLSTLVELPPEPPQAQESQASRNLNYWLDFFFGEKK